MDAEKPAIADIAERLGAVHIALRSDLEVTRHYFRRKPYYVVRDPLTFQTHQFTHADYQILISVNDEHSLGEIFSSLVDQKRLALDQEEDFFQFILKLHSLGFLSLPISDSKILYRRFAHRQRMARWRRASSFMFLRIPLFHPDGFLDRTVDFMRPLFTRGAFAVWIVMMLVAAGVLVREWDSFRRPIHSILANDTLLFLWVALIGLKVFHEFGHAYACKVFGGKVPEMGAFLIAFTPCAYVDASSAWGFASIRQRIIVSLAGMYFESIVAIIALFVWAWTDNPWLDSCAHHIVVLATAVTIGFNINPLMRYDGYYVFSDLVGIPNLRQRSTDRVKALCKRLFLGIRSPQVEESRRTRLLLLGYGVAAVLYRVTIVLAICTMISLKFYLIGIVLAAMFLVTFAGGSLLRLLAYLWHARETRPVRVRAVALSLVLLVLLPTALATVPVPGTTVVPGIVETRDDRIVHAESSGFLNSAAADIGDRVDRHQPLCALRNPKISADVAESQAQTDLMRLEYREQLASNQFMASTASLRLAQAEDKLRQVTREFEQLVVEAPIAGTITDIVDRRDTGRFFKKGDRVATVSTGPWVVRCALDAEQLADICPTVGATTRIRGVAGDVRELAGAIDEVAVKGSRRVFSPALTQLGGGNIAISPDSQEADQPLFEVVVRLRHADRESLRHGVRVNVLFPTRPQTYGSYFYKRFRQFLNKLRMR